MSQSKEVNQSSKKFGVKRAGELNYKCDVCGNVFSGVDAQKKYHKHLEEEHMNKISYDFIQSPKTVDIVDKKDDKDKIKIVGAKKGSLEELLNKMTDCCTPVVMWQSKYYCPACQLRMKYNKGIAPDKFWFDSIEEFDSHLWTFHNLVVVRGDNFSVTNRKTGEKINE